MVNPFSPFSWLASVLACCISLGAHASGFSMMGDQRQLAGLVVLAAGNFSEVQPPSGHYSARTVLRMNQYCFEPMGILGLWGYGEKAGLVATDIHDQLKVVIIESSFSSIKVEVHDAVQVRC